MAVTNQIPRNVSTAAAGATVFPYDFKILDKADLQVTVDGVAKVVDVDFTVSGVGIDSGGDITFLASMVGGEVVMRKRNMAFQRQADYQNLGDLRSATLNNDQDAPVMMIQQLGEEVARAVRVSPDTAGATSLILPTPAPLGLLGWNAAGNGFETYTPDAFVTSATAGVTHQYAVTAGQSEIPIPQVIAPFGVSGLFYNGIFQDPSGYSVASGKIAFSEPLPAPGTVSVMTAFKSSDSPVDSDQLFFTGTRTGVVTRAIRAKLDDIVSVKDFGATGDGSTNDAAAIQLAINSGAKTLTFPAGVYMLGAELKPRSNQAWVGSPRGTTLKLNAGAATNLNVAAHNQDGLDGSLDNFSASDIVFDANGKDAGFVIFGCSEVRFTDCVFQNGGTYGLAFQARPGYTITLPQDRIDLTRCLFLNNGSDDPPGFDGLDIKWCTNTTLTACEARGNTDVGINIRGRNVRLLGCSASGNRTCGILLQSNDSTENSYIQVSGGHADGTTAGPGLEIQGAGGLNTYADVSGFQSYGNVGSGVRISGLGKVIGSITGLQSRGNTLDGLEITGDYVGNLVVSGGLLMGNGRCGFQTAGKNTVLSDVSILSNTGSGYKENTGADNNFVMPTCVISGNAVNMAARVGSEVDAGFMSARSDAVLRLFPGLSAGLELSRAGDGTFAAMAAVGVAASVDMKLLTKGSGDVSLWNQGGARQLAVFREAGSTIVNYPDFVASIAGSPVAFYASGSDTDIDIAINPKGAGKVRFGGLSASADVPITGYITIKDSGGTARKLAVIA